MGTDNQAAPPPAPARNINGIIFAIVVLLYQVIICLFYGFWFRYNSNYSSTFPADPLLGFNDGQLQLVALLTILAIVGFGLVNAYISNASFSGMGLSLLIFGLTLQHYFLIKAFWEKAGVANPHNIKNFNVTNGIVPMITFVNNANTHYYNPTTGLPLVSDTNFVYTSYSFVDAIACAICNIIAFSSVVGRVKTMEIFEMTLIGTFIYQINEQLLWRFEISDTGYGMRIFIYGGVMGLLSTLILGKKQTTANHRKYFSSYATRSFALLGLLVQFCTFPCLVAASLFQTDPNNRLILYSAVLRMFLALVAGILGSFSASALLYKKIMIHDLVFGALAGGIVYSSSSDLHPNPSIPLTVGFVMAFLSTLYQSRQLRWLNQSGVTTSLAYLTRFLIPGLLCGILSAILMAINQGGDSSYKLLHSRDPSPQAGFQMAGIGLSIAFGIGAGLIIGILYRLINGNDYQNQFNDCSIYTPDFPLQMRHVPIREN